MTVFELLGDEFIAERFHIEGRPKWLVSLVDQAEHMAKQLTVQELLRMNTLVYAEWPDQAILEVLRTEVKRRIPSAI